MKTLAEIVTIAINADSLLSGLWPSDNGPEDYPQAVRCGLKNRHVESLEPEELQTLQSWCNEVQPRWLASDESGQNTYYEYPDGSVYLSSTAEDDIWDCAGDLADSIIEGPSASPLDPMDVALLQHCGRLVYQVCRGCGDILCSWSTESAAVESARDFKRQNPAWELVVMENQAEILKI